eukprot:4153901-Prymnesium_polylepis.1
MARGQGARGARARVLHVVHPHGQQLERGGGDRLALHRLGAQEAQGGRGRPEAAAEARGVSALRG